MSVDSTIEKDPFWSHDITVLFDSRRLVEFIPSGDMTNEEKLNALTRFLIYAGIILILYIREWWTLYIPLLGAGFTLFLYKTSKTVRSPMKPYEPEETHALQVDTTLTQAPYCTPPSQNNPFMNVLMSEWTDNPNRPPACNYNGVKDDMENHFSYNLYRDIDDLFDKNNSQRQFYTNPITTIPNDQGSFARWLYEVPSTCKEDGENCLRYEDLRFNRPTFGDSEYLV